MNKRRITNILGIVVFGTIIIGVTLQRGIQLHQEKEKIRNDEAKTKQLADKLAKCLVGDSSGDLVMQFARGQYLDAWNNPFVIEHNTIENGACVRSYGVDGVKNTEDDVLSHVYDYRQTQFKIETQPVKTNMEKIKDRFEGAKQKLGEAIKNSSAEIGLDI